MAGGQIIRTNGAVGIGASGGRSIMGPAGENCGCCAAGSSCTRCSGDTPTAISVAFSGILFRNLTCDMCQPLRTYGWIGTPNLIYSLPLVIENQNGCTFSGSFPGIRERVFFQAGCLGASQPSDGGLGISVFIPSTGGLTVDMILDQLSVGTPTIFRHSTSDSRCIRDLGSLINQVPSGYLNQCSMGGGGGTATISF